MRSVIKAEIPPAIFLEAARAAFEQAVSSAGGIVERQYSIAGFAVRLQYAGQTLVAQTAPALAHLESTHHSVPDLTVRLWDSTSTHTPFPRFPWPDHVRQFPGEIRAYSDEDFFAVHIPELQMLTVLDARRNAGMFWISDAAYVPTWETAMPLHRMFHWWMSRHGRQLAHSAAVGTHDGAVLLVGKGGSGKSTTALTCLDAGLCYLGDDYVILETGPESYAHSLYSTAKLSCASLQMLPQFRSRVADLHVDPDEKYLLFLSEVYPRSIQQRLPIRALLMPRVTGLRDTSLRRASPAAGLAALAPNTILALPYSGPQALPTMAGVVGQAPNYVLEVGTDLHQIPAVITGLLASLKGRDTPEARLS